METRSAKRRKTSIKNSNIEKGCVSVDRISDLPDEILHIILSKLPSIKSIAQTSVLSKRWKHVWQCYPDLEFTAATVYNNNKNYDRRRISLVINQVLSNHDNFYGIRVFRLKSACLTFTCLNTLFRTAIKKNVQEIDVEVSTDDYFNFPRSVLMSKSLKVLKLRSLYPGFRLPPPLILKNGFQFLISLSLSRVILYDQPCLLNLFEDLSFPKLMDLTLEMCVGLKKLNVRCRGIQELKLTSCFDLNELRICIPGLKKLSVTKCFDFFSDNSFVEINAPMLGTIYWLNVTLTHKSVLENLNSLNEAFVGIITHEDFCSTKVHSFFGFLSGISSCQFLTLEALCIEALSANGQLGTIHQPFNRLKSLELRTCFKKHNLPELARLFTNATHLETLVIIIVFDFTLGRRKRRNLSDTSHTGEESFWESQSQALNSFLCHLRVAKIKGFSESDDEIISLVKFLLKHGKVLQEVFLCSSQLSKSKRSLRKEEIKSRVMGFSRASSNAKIFFQHIYNMYNYN